MKTKVIKSYSVKSSGKKITINTIADLNINSNFEPKIYNRFFVKLSNEYTKEVIASHFINSTDRPSSYKNFFGIKKYYPLHISIYDPVTPNIVQLTESNFNSGWNIEINILGPIGDIIETWEIKNAKLEKIKYSSFDWADTGNCAKINLTFKIKNVKLL